MRAALLLLGWALVGVWVARTGPRTPVEYFLALLFWPFFLGRKPEPGPIDRLKQALEPGDPAQELVAELEAAMKRLQARLSRIEKAIAALGPGSPEGPSRRLLLEARARLRAELETVMAAIDEAAARLYLMQDAGDRSEVEALLRALRARLHAGEEAERAAG